ncbi:MAG TPA: transposase [Bacillota bacterium]|nr:transposase [Bacillota bacterium]HOL09730.1 transposase [Bacillota bacterium]HPO98187.1 transposase [Bacillota bacterium]
MEKTKFTDEFKQQIIRETKETRNCALVAINYDLSPSLVAKWVREADNYITYYNMLENLWKYSFPPCQSNFIKEKTHKNNLTGSLILNWLFNCLG